jgi:acylphosphatase
VGSQPACELLLADLGGSATPGRVTAVVERWSEARGVPPGFRER